MTRSTRCVGRDLLHLHLPDFRVYRGPTEHPLAIAFGMLCSIFGQGGARLMVLGSIAPTSRSSRHVSPRATLLRAVVGLLAALLALSRFFDENLAAQGYLESPTCADHLAVVLEVERPRRGVAVLVTLAAAGLLRPTRGAERRLLAVVRVAAPRGGAVEPGTRGPAGNRERLKLLALAVSAPVLWACMDGVVTGNPLYSLTSTAGLARNWNARRASAACSDRYGPMGCASTRCRCCSARSPACHWQSGCAQAGADARRRSCC